MKKERRVSVIANEWVDGSGWRCASEIDPLFISNDATDEEVVKATKDYAQEWADNCSEVEGEDAKLVFYTVELDEDGDEDGERTEIASYWISELQG